MKHLTGGIRGNEQVAQIQENKRCIQKSILPQTSGECGGRSKHTLQYGKSGLAKA
jgi:hypothetical protein